MPYCWVAVLLGFLSCSAAPVPAREAFLPVGRLSGIVLPAEHSAVEEEAARLLQSGLKRLTGTAVPIIERPPAGGVCVHVGAAAAIGSGIVRRRELDALRPGGYAVRSVRAGVAVAGPTPFATLYAATAFLERLGMRFFRGSLADAAVPAARLTEIPFFSAADRPVFVYRGGWNALHRMTSRELGDPRQALDPELFDPKKTGSDLWIDHSAGYLVPKLLHYDRHPEYYAMDESGRRAAKDSFSDHRTPLCLSNPDVGRIAAERAAAWAAAQPDRNFFMVTYGDTGLWCRCPDCLSLDPVAGQYATRLLSWVNPVARAVGAVRPDAVVVTAAYGGSDVPPPAARPGENVWILAATGLGNIPFWDHAVASSAPALERNLPKIDGWLKAAPRRLTVCEYLSGVYEPALLDTMAGRLRFYARRGVRGIMFTYGNPVNFTALWQYVWSRLSWNPALDPVPIAREFLAAVHGPAAGPLAEYFDLARARYRETLRARRPLDGLYPAGFYGGGFAESALDCFARAGAAAGTPSARAEIGREERLFICDWMVHPVSRTMDTAAVAVLERQLARLAVLAGGSDAEKIAFARDVHRTAVAAEAVQPGALARVEAWLKAQNLPRPGAEAIPGGVRIPAEAFMFAGVGPQRYAENCPPKTMVAIYIAGNSMNRSSRMEAEFLLDGPAPGAAVLEIEGQDCDHDVPPAEIRVRINGTVVHEGPVTVVKKNWSRQSFAVPAGALRAGRNTIEIANTGAPESAAKWYHRWFMLSEAIVRFR